VATLKDELQNLRKNSRAVTDITTDRDMLALKLKNLTVENEASDLLVLTMIKQIGTLNTDLNLLSTTNKTTCLELMAAEEEVSAMKNELISTKELLEKANAKATSLSCQLTSTNEALDSMVRKFKSVTDEIDLLKNCIDDFVSISKT
jgi:chromosome segregation ATPase